MAQAGGKNPAGMEDAIAAAEVLEGQPGVIVRSLSGRLQNNYG